jgi:hypothetical protein
MTTTCHVYAKCTAGRRHFLQEVFKGSRTECNTHVKQRTRNGQPTHFLEVSSLAIEAATKKFFDGARFDPIDCCYYD